MKRLAAIITAVLFTAMTGCGVETEQSVSVAVTEYSRTIQSIPTEGTKISNHFAESVT